MILRISMSALLLAAVGGCTFSFPVVGRISEGDAMQGTVVVSTSGEGKFEVFEPDGLRCFGSYDAMNNSNTITFPLTCSDGRTGTVIATRDNTGIKGTAIAKLSDGTRGEFVFGQISAQDQAAFLARSAQQ